MTLILKTINQYDIGKQCIKIAKSEQIFEQYIMDLYWDKYNIEIQDDNTIKRNRIFFDFMQQTFNSLDGLYIHENFLLIDAIKEDKLRNNIAEEI